MRFILLFAVLLFVGCGETVTKSGEQLFYEKCISCHPASTVFDKKGDKNYWDKVVKQMKSYGLSISSGEAKVVSKYLSELN
jgi:cytochrome c5